MTIKLSAEAYKKMLEADAKVDTPEMQQAIKDFVKRVKEFDKEHDIRVEEIE